MPDKIDASAVKSHAPKKPRRSHAERTERSEKLMLDAARDLILSVGTHNTTLKDIGEKAGYSRGLANAHFGSKDTLFTRLVKRCRLIWIAEMQKAAQGKSGLDVLLSRIDAMISFANKYPKDARAMYSLWFESIGTDSHINASHALFHSQAREDIKRLALDAGLFKGAECDSDAAVYAEHFVGSIFGLIYQWLVNPNAVDIIASLSNFRNRLSSLAAQKGG